MGSVQFSSEEDYPLSSGQDDRRKVRKRINRPLGRSDLMDRRTDKPAKVETSVDMGNDSLMDKQPVDELPEWSDSELMPLIFLKDTSAVDMMDLTGCPLPKSSELLSPRSPATMGFEDQEVCSPPLSPNLVREGHSQDMPMEGSIFDASPDFPGSTCDRLVSALTLQISPSLCRRFMAVSMTHSSEHRSLCSV